MPTTGFVARIRSFFSGALEIRDALDIVRTGVDLVLSTGVLKWLSFLWADDPLWAQIPVATGVGLVLFGVASLMTRRLRHRAGESGETSAATIPAPVPALPPKPLVQVRNRMSRNEEVSLDGHDYEGCEFTDCAFSYHGGPFRIGANKLTGPTKVVSTNNGTIAAWEVMRALNLIDNKRVQHFKVTLPNK